MKKLVCGCFGNIYYATILSNGYMSDKGRVDVTDDAIDAVLQHLIAVGTETWREDSFAGYDITTKDDKQLTLCVYDKTKYKLVKRDEKR